MLDSFVSFCGNGREQKVYRGCNGVYKEATSVGKRIVVKLLAIEKMDIN